MTISTESCTYYFMTKFFIAFLIFAIALLNSSAQTLLKLGADKKSLNFYLAGGVVFYFVSFLAYVFVLSKMNLSAAYPVTIGLTMIATVLISMFYLKEHIPPFQAIGITLILLGIISFILDKWE